MPKMKAKTSCQLVILNFSSTFVELNLTNPLSLSTQNGWKIVKLRNLNYEYIVKIYFKNNILFFSFIIIFISNSLSSDFLQFIFLIILNLIYKLRYLIGFPKHFKYCFLNQNYYTHFASLYKWNTLQRRVLGCLVKFDNIILNDLKQFVYIVIVLC